MTTDTKSESEKLADDRFDATPDDGVEGFDITYFGNGDNDETNPKDRLGLKKPPMHCVPPIGLVHLGLAMENGMNKYGLMNWREKKVRATVYYDAMMRHLMAWIDGEEMAADSKVKHLAHVMACCAILLDAEYQGNLVDDRPLKGEVARLLNELTEARSTK